MPKKRATGIYKWAVKGGNRMAAGGAATSYDGGD